MQNVTAKEILSINKADFNKITSSSKAIKYKATEGKYGGPCKRQSKQRARYLRAGSKRTMPKCRIQMLF